MFLTGLFGLLSSIIALVSMYRTLGLLSSSLAIIAFLSMLAVVYGFGMAAYMTYTSRIGKRRTRERLLDLKGQLSPWTGEEKVLDVGCGRGLMMVGAARRLTSGTAVGVDIWRQEDQAANKPEAALENARIEGVLDRLSVETGDARALPFPDASFDVVLSHWVIHNMPEAEDRARALDEMLRVLRPGGVLVLADIANKKEYQTHLKSRGLSDIREFTGGFGTQIVGVLTGGSFKPQALFGLKFDQVP